MDPSRPNRILDEWSAVAHAARRPAAPPRGIVVRSGLPGATLAGAGLVVVALVVAGLLLGRPGPDGGVGSSASTLPSPTSPLASAPTEAPSASATPSAAPSAAPTPSAALTPSAAPTVGPCDPATVAARITLWEGAAGHRIADVDLTNTGSEPCMLEAMARPQLVDGHGSVLIDGSTPPTSAFLTIAPGGVVKTLVQDGNYCGPDPVVPVSVAFVFNDGSRVVAAPMSATDGTVPPCLGAPGSAGDIEMHPWAP